MLQKCPSLTKILPNCIWPAQLATAGSCCMKANAYNCSVCPEKPDNWTDPYITPQYRRWINVEVRKWFQRRRGEGWRDEGARRRRKLTMLGQILLLQIPLIHLKDWSWLEKCIDSIPQCCFPSSRGTVVTACPPRSNISSPASTQVWQRKYLESQQKSKWQLLQS